MKRVLLIGTSYSAAPFLKCLKAMGLHVSVCGTKPADPCVALADAYHELDYADRAAVLALTRRKKFDYLCPTCNEPSYLSGAYVAERLGLPGFDSVKTADTIHDKAQFRKFAAAAGIPSPRTFHLSQETDSLPGNFPLPALVKPVDSSGGRGIGRVDRRAALNGLVANARAQSQRSEVLIEELVEGSLHSHSAFVRGAKIVEDFFVDEFCEVYPYQVDCSNYPSRLPQRIREKVRRAVTSIITGLRLRDGLLHTQFITNGARIAVIEVMRRCPGDLYYHLVEFATGAHYIRNYVAPFVGKSIMPSKPRAPSNWIRHTISFPRDTVFWWAQAQIPKAEIRTFPLCESADLVAKAPYGKAAIIFARMPTRKDMLRITPKIAQYLTVECSRPSHE